MTFTDEYYILEIKIIYFDNLKEQLDRLLKSKEEPKIARPTNASKIQGNYLKEQIQAISNCLNELETICKTTNIEQKEDLTGTIGLLVGKTMVRFSNLVEELNVDFSE